MCVCYDVLVFLLAPYNRLIIYIYVERVGGFGWYKQSKYCWVFMCLVIQNIDRRRGYLHEINRGGLHVYVFDCVCVCLLLLSIMR